MKRKMTQLLSLMDKLNAVRWQDTELMYLKYPPKGMEQDYATPDNIDQLFTENKIQQASLSSEIERVFDEVTR